jgi:glycosyltransferase involved in cell wall biosynthesis
MDLPRTLFMSRGNNGTAWYRCALPAIALDCGWVCYGGEPPNLQLVWGKTQDDISVADLAGYDVLIVQQPSGPAWLKAIRDWQRQGIVVLIDVDDYLRSVRKKRDHDFADLYSKKRVEEYEMCMRVADGLICSTEWLADKYRSLNPVTHVCRNGIDLKRYALTLPERAHVGVGWAGATGHLEAVVPWLKELQVVMRAHDDVRLITVGQGFADMFVEEFGAVRALSVPFTALDVYPAAMTHFDVALAPAGESNFYRGKSDLRWLEAAALAIPTIAHPLVYPEIEHGVTGFHAATPGAMRAILVELVGDRDLRRRVGHAAQAHVREHRSAQVAARQWEAVLQQVAPVRAVA